MSLTLALLTLTILVVVVLVFICPFPVGGIESISSRNSEFVKSPVSRFDSTRCGEMKTFDKNDFVAQKTPCRSRGFSVPSLLSKEGETLLEQGVRNPTQEQGAANSLPPEQGVEQPCP